LEKPIDADSLNFIRSLYNFWNTDIRKAMPEWEHAINDPHWENLDELKKIDDELKQYV